MTTLIELTVCEIIELYQLSIKLFKIDYDFDEEKWTRSRQVFENKYLKGKDEK